MAIPTATQHVDGEYLEYNLGSKPVSFNFIAYRLWVNRIATGDVAASAVQQEHLVRPRLGRDFQGERRLILPIEYGLLDSGVDPSLVAWATRRKRISFDPSKYSADDVIRLPIGRTFTIPGTPDTSGTAKRPQMSVGLTMTCFIRSPTAGVTYPDGVTATRARGGYLQLFLYDRAANAEYEIGELTNFLYPMVGHTASFEDTINLSWTKDAVDASATVGGTVNLECGQTYDLYVGYARQGGDITIAQIDITRVVGKIDVFW